MVIYCLLSTYCPVLIIVYHVSVAYCLFPTAYLVFVYFLQYYVRYICWFIFLCLLLAAVLLTAYYYFVSCTAYFLLCSVGCIVFVA